MAHLQGAYPDGFTQAQHDPLFNSTPDDNDRQAAAEELAEEDFDVWARGEDDTGTVADYVYDHAGERIRVLLAGLLGDATALEAARKAAQQLRTDAIGYAAWLMDDERIEDAQ